MTAPAVGDFATAAWATSIVNGLPPSVWTSYVPAWTTAGTAPNPGNGTLVGYYLKLGDGYLVRIRFIAGSTTTFGTGIWFFSVPFARNAADVFDGAISGVALSGANRYLLMSQDNNNTSFSLMTNQSITTVGSTVPFTWTTGSSFGIRGFYEGV